MGQNRYKKLYLSDLEKEIKHEHGEQFLKDFKTTYYWSKLSSAIFESRNLYYREWNKPKKGSVGFRLTYPIFIISALTIHWLGGALKWIFTGDSEIFKPKSKIRLFFEKWNDKGGFDFI